MIIYNQRTNGIQNPLGFKYENICLTWSIKEAQGKFFRKGKLQISLDPQGNNVIYDTQDLQSQSCLGLVVPLALQPCTRYYWQVQIEDEKQNIAISPIAWFETGKMASPWQGKWIKSALGKTTHPMMIKNFSLPESYSIDALEKARLYICGLGVYEAYLNGHKIGDEVLAPFFNNYNHWLQYQTYDIAPYLKEKDNILQIALGDGWFKGRFGFLPDYDRLFGQEFYLLCDATLTFNDHFSQTISSDETWRCFPSPIVSSSIYDGEVYDSNIAFFNSNPVQFLTLEDFSPASALMVSTNTSLLEARLSPPLRIIQRFHPPKVLFTPRQEFVLDFGQIVSGWVEFEIDLPLGQEIHLFYSEVMQEDNFYNDNLRTAKQEYRFISNGQPQTVRPHFTFYGFRFVKVVGLEKIDLDHFTACVICSDLTVTGDIQTSNPKVNQLFSNVMWGQRGNFLDVPTDCPQRDERMGWTGDAQVFTPTASFNMYTPAFFHKFMYDMFLEQQEDEGSVPFVVPNVLKLVSDTFDLEQRVFSFEAKNPEQDGVKPAYQPNALTASITHGSCVWGDAATIIPWTLYQMYGNQKMLEQHFPSMTAWVDFIYQQEETFCQGKRLWKHGFHFGDWLALDNPDPTSSFGGTDAYYVASAYYFYSALLTSKAAFVLGKDALGQKYFQLSQEIKTAIKQEYFSPQGTLNIPTQTAVILALHLGFAPEEYKPTLVQQLKTMLDENNLHLNTGFVGTAYIALVLSQFGLDEYAYHLLLHEDYPSWLYEVNMGATTIWERWNSILPDGSISDTGMNSLNHYAYGCIAEWMYRYMCGISPDPNHPGFKQFILQPRIDPRLTWVKGKYESAAGLCKSAWFYKEQEICFELEIPFDTKAVFHLPSVPSFSTLSHTSKILLNNTPCPILIAKGCIVLEAGNHIIAWKK